MPIYAFIVAVLGLTVAAAHSMLGERVILGPLYREPTNGLLAVRATRDIIRAVFHIPSLAWAGLGVAVLLNRLQSGSDLLPVVAIIIFALSGIANIAALRRPHPGGVMLLTMAFATFADIRFN